MWVGWKAGCVSIIQKLRTQKRHTKCRSEYANQTHLIDECQEHDLYLLDTGNEQYLV